MGKRIPGFRGIVRRAVQAAVRRGAPGYTLIEIMVASLLLVTAMAGIVPFYISGLAHAASSRQLSVATNIAREKMEEIRQLDYREVVEDPENPTAPTNLSMRFGSSVHVTERNMTFKINYEVDQLPGQAAKSVQVTVSWDPPPFPISPAVVKTVIAEQYLGPKMAKLEVLPTDKDNLPPADSGGTPFPLLKTDGTPTTIRAHIADSDWFLAYDDLTVPLPSPNDISLKYLFRDDAGGSVGVHTVPNTALATVISGTDVKDIYFQDTFDAHDIPDGYWDLEVTMYNAYDEPGNTWQLRVRVEKGPPVAPSSFTATPTSDTTIVLTWIPGSERDRQRYVLERREVDATGAPLASPSGDWTTVADDLPANTTTYTDTGELDPGGNTALDLPPCGRSGDPRYFQYRIYGVDTGGRSAPDDPNCAATSDIVALGDVVATPKVSVPSVTGMLLAAAETTLAATKVDPSDPTSPGLGWAVTEEVNSTVPPGTVLTQDPSPGTQVEEGSIVALKVAIATPPPSSSYNVTFTKTNNPGTTIYVFDDAKNKVFQSAINKKTSASASLPNGHYSISLSASGSPTLQTFYVNGADMTVTVP
jgi:type II secretory pathway pseudopilin PulG